MAHLVLTELDVYLVVGGEVAVQGLSDLGYILGKHWPQVGRARLIRQLVKLIEFSLRHVGRSVGEAHVNELLRVQVSVPVLRSGPRRRKSCA